MELCISRRSTDGVWSNHLPAWDGESTLVQVFGPASLLDDPSPLQEIDRLYPTSVVVGCSGAGSVVDDDLVDDELVVSVARFEHVRLSVAFGAVSQSGDQEGAGAEVREKLLALDPSVTGMLVYSGGLMTDGDSLSAGLDNGKQTYTVCGGLAGSVPTDDGFGVTWVLNANRRPESDSISAVGFSGDSLVMSSAARGGWKPLGTERTITKSEGAVLYEIDGMPALDIYKEYLGDRAADLPAVALLFPLSSRPKSGGPDSWSPAGVVGVDEETRSLQLTRRLPQNNIVQMLRGYSGELFEAAEDAATDLEHPGPGPHLAIATSCLGRRITLGSRTPDELTYVRQALPDNVGMVGFYAMGEFSPTPSVSCQLYNYTMTLTLLGERVP